ncbi:MAG: metallophosphoesterase [Anaerolineae bacterium]|nr:MAG: metallophosphoesterase [Anaerolineae bacterium]
MRTLVISDIHANLVALEAVLTDADGLWDRVWFLGDLVGYGPNPNECVERLRDLEPLALSGNHDWAVLGKLDTDEFNEDARRMVRWTRNELTEENLAYLEGLPPRHVAAPFTMAHASPRHPVWEYILDLQTALENFDYFDTSCCLVGHSHIPALFALDETAAELNFYLVGHGDTIDLKYGRSIVNPGSVGQPRDGDPRAAYALLDNETMTWEFHRVAYDIAETQARMRRHKLPARLIERLEFGV